MDKPIPDLITVEAARDTHRWVAMTALLLAIGVILHTISPNVGGVTPNWTIDPGPGHWIRGRSDAGPFFQIRLPAGEHRQ